MRFKGLDLNLLVALDVLLTERNVSRAADRLFLSQSATSGALARLRDYFGDELLVQVGRKMVLTPRAQALAAKVRAALMQIDGTIIQPPQFDPATVRRTIRIVASDYVIIAELAQAIRAIRAQAPGLTLIVNPPQDQPAQSLDQGEIDLLLMPEVYLSQDHPSEAYFEDTYVAVVWAGSTAHGATLTEDQFFAARHVTMQFAPRTPTYEAWFMKNRGEDRQAAVVAGSFAAVPFLIEGTDNVALLHRRLALRFAQMMPLRILPSPVPIPPLVEHLQWHGMTAGDECLTWVRQQILAARQV